jgi:hypothetical protein
MVNNISDYKHQSFFQWKHKDGYYSLLENSKIFDMTLEEYREYIGTQLEVNVLDTVYQSPALVSKDGEMKVLVKRLETFFDKDRDINRNQNIKKAYDYGYTKTQIANFVQLTPKSISNILEHQD